MFGHRRNEEASACNDEEVTRVLFNLGSGKGQKKNIRLPKALLNMSAGKVNTSQAKKEKVKESSNIRSNQVSVSHLVNPADFYVVFKDDETRLARIARQLSDSWNNLQKVNKLVMGNVYAIDVESKKWRAMCIKNNGFQEVNGETDALYHYRAIDQGFQVDIPTSLVRVLPEDLAAIPPLATKCSLNIGTLGNVWSRKCMQLFQDLTSKPILLTVLDKGGPAWLVDLIRLPDGATQNDQIASFRRKLVVPRFGTYVLPPATKPSDSPLFCHQMATKHDGSCLTGRVTCVNHPSCFYVQFDDAKTEPEFRDLTVRLQEQLSSAELQIKRESSLLVVDSPEISQAYAVSHKNARDGGGGGGNTWYRVLLEDFSCSKEVLVFFVDTGYREVINQSQLRLLPSK